MTLVRRGAIVAEAVDGKEAAKPVNMALLCEILERLLEK